MDEARDHSERTRRWPAAFGLTRSQLDRPSSSRSGGHSGDAALLAALAGSAPATPLAARSEAKTSSLEAQLERSQLSKRSFPHLAAPVAKEATRRGGATMTAARDAARPARNQAIAPSAHVVAPSLPALPETGCKVCARPAAALATPAAAMDDYVDEGAPRSDDFAPAAEEEPSRLRDVIAWVRATEGE